MQHKASRKKAVPRMCEADVASLGKNSNTMRQYYQRAVYGTEYVPPVVPVKEAKPKYIKRTAEEKELAKIEREIKRLTGKLFLVKGA